MSFKDSSNLSDSSLFGFTILSKYFFQYSSKCSSINAFFLSSDHSEKSSGTTTSEGKNGCFVNNESSGANNNAKNKPKSEEPNC